MLHRSTVRKNIRLPKSAYLGQQFYFVTMCCSDRNAILTDPNLCQSLLGFLRTESAGRDFAVHAYCLMPDHVHFLVEGTKPTSDLLGLVKSSKIKSCRMYAERTSQVLWQKKYFDHILRKHDSPEAVAWYMWMNPVRAALAATVGEYPFAGLFTGLMERLVARSDSWTPPWKLQKTPASEGGRYKT